MYICMCIGEVLQWLMKYPHQCVILSLECFWSTAIQSCLEPLVNCKKLEELRYVCTYVCTNVSIYPNGIHLCTYHM